MGRLDGQVTIVTGGSRGIGRAVALAFAHEGARVAVAAAQDRDTLRKIEEEIAAIGGDSIAMLADVCRRGDVEGVVQAALSKWGRIDVLVNNAGILRLGPLESISEERWDETLAVHLNGTFHCTQAVIPIMKQQGKGKIINIAAPSALRGSFGVADYAAAKGGIIAFTKNAASELGAYNIQVNLHLAGGGYAHDRGVDKVSPRTLGHRPARPRIRPARSDRAGLFILRHGRFRSRLGTTDRSRQNLARSRSDKRAR